MRAAAAEPGLRNEMMPMHLIVDLARDLAIVAIELVVLISLG